MAAPLAPSAHRPCRTGERRAVGALLLALASGLAGCGDGEVRYEIRDVRVDAQAGPPAPVGASEEERFLGSDGTSPHGAPVATSAPAPQRRWEFTTPMGWRELPPGPMRVHGWQAGPEGRGECTLSVLEGEAGGLAANVNRWRRQMSVPPAEAADLAALPRVPWLGTSAWQVEIDGAYRGMGAEVLQNEARLLALVAQIPGGTVFLKFVGPAGVVAAERSKFQALAGSLRLMEEVSPAPAGPEPTAERARLAWTAPSGWVQQPARAMREVTYSPASAPAVTAYITRLTGTAGGVRANVDRWRGEMALGPLSDAEFAALARWPVLGGTGVYVELEGTFSGMSGSPAPGSGMLGLVLERPQGSVFVKMTGPAAQVRTERERFRAFCESLRE